MLLLKSASLYWLLRIGTNLKKAIKFGTTPKLSGPHMDSTSLASLVPLSPNFSLVWSGERGYGLLWEGLPFHLSPSCSVLCRGGGDHPRKDFLSCFLPAVARCFTLLFATHFFEGLSLTAEWEIAHHSAIRFKWLTAILLFSFTCLQFGGGNKTKGLSGGQVNPLIWLLLSFEAVWSKTKVLNLFPTTLKVGNQGVK